MPLMLLKGQVVYSIIEAVQASSVGGKMTFFRKWFRKTQDPELAIRKLVEDFLLHYPQCGRDVVIASPEYVESHYACEVLVSAADLLPWAKHHAEMMWCTHQKDQAARVALPLWLCDADSSNNTASKIPHSMYEMLRPYIYDFVVAGSAKYFCFECQSFVTDVRREQRDEKGCAIFSTWTDVWTCPQGHQLYYEEHEMRVHFGKNLPKSDHGAHGDHGDHGDYEIPEFLRSRPTKD